MSLPCALAVALWPDYARSRVGPIALTNVPVLDIWITQEAVFPPYFDAANRQVLAWRFKAPSGSTSFRGFVWDSSGAHVNPNAATFVGSIYSDSSGTPGSLLASQSVTTGPSGSGGIPTVYFVFGSPPTVTPGNFYWAVITLTTTTNVTEVGLNRDSSRFGGGLGLQLGPPDSSWYYGADLSSLYMATETAIGDAVQRGVSWQALVVMDGLAAVVPAAGGRPRLEFAPYGGYTAGVIGPSPNTGPVPNTWLDLGNASQVAQTWSTLTLLQDATADNKLLLYTSRAGPWYLETSNALGGSIVSVSGASSTTDAFSRYPVFGGLRTNDGSFVVFFGQHETVGGTVYRRAAYQTVTAGGTVSATTLLNAGSTRHYDPVDAIVDASNRVHLYWQDNTDNPTATLYHAVLDTDGTLGAIGTMATLHLVYPGGEWSLGLGCACEGGASVPVLNAAGCFEEAWYPSDLTTTDAVLRFLPVDPVGKVAGDATVSGAFVNIAGDGLYLFEFGRLNGLLYAARRAAGGSSWSGLSTVVGTPTGSGVCGNYISAMSEIGFLFSIGEVFNYFDQTAASYGTFSAAAGCTRHGRSYVQLVGD